MLVMVIRVTSARRFEPMKPTQRCKTTILYSNCDLFLNLTEEFWHLYSRKFHWTLDIKFTTEELQIFFVL